MTPRVWPAGGLAELQTALRARDVSPSEVLQALHAQIAENDPRIGAYLSIDLAAALRPRFA